MKCLNRCCCCVQVEHIVREDYMVEGMEILEMFCDLLLARFGIIERVRYAAIQTSTILFLRPIKFPPKMALSNSNLSNSVESDMYSKGRILIKK